MDKSLNKAKKKLFSRLSREIRCEPVIRAMEQIPRERFVPAESRHMSYSDQPLAIGEGQTISQPYIVALMLKELRLQGYERVLEVGTGSGYQAAILSVLVPQGRVVTVELIPFLAERASELLNELGCDNVEVKLAGPALGCPERGPFDAIVVSAASPQLPEFLVSQFGARRESGYPSGESGAARAGPRLPNRRRTVRENAGFVPLRSLNWTRGFSQTLELFLPGPRPKPRFLSGSHG